MRALRIGVIIGAVIWLEYLGGVTPALGQAVFTRLARPNGVTTDLAGNVFVHHDTGAQNQVTKFLPDGTPVGSLPIGGFLDINFTGRLATDPGTGLLLEVLVAGILLVIAPDTLQIFGALDLRTLPPDARAAYDVGTGLVRDFSGAILPGRISYGDLAVLRRGGQLDLYLTGVSVGTAFVMRLRVLADGTILPPRVLVASSPTTAGTVNQPRGVAVNGNGTALTTLPAIPTPAGRWTVWSRSARIWSPRRGRRRGSAGSISRAAG
jgi:hypothetical protein